MFKVGYANFSDKCENFACFCDGSKFFRQNTNSDNAGIHLALKNIICFINFLLEIIAKVSNVYYVNTLLKIQNNTITFKFCSCDANCFDGCENSLVSMMDQGCTDRIQILVTQVIYKKKN